MKNILNIIKHDFIKCGSSVVAMITIMGLCIVPCLYAWFNIFSNWAPYESEATSRISVAVANEDQGASAAGITVNVGERITSALQANDDIGWVFVDSSQEAIDGVYAGDYYAALVIPGDFSADVLSFLSGDLENPVLKYYENEKKNAIAPKITGKAKTAVQEEVNSTFVETLAGYVADAVSVADATGYNPQSVFADLSNQIDLLSERLDNCIVMINAARSLSDSAHSLLAVSGALTDSAGNAVNAEEKVVDETTSIDLPDSGSYTKVAESVDQINTEIDGNLENLEDKLSTAAEDQDAYNKFVEKELEVQEKITSEMEKSSKNASEALKKIGMDTLAEKFEDMHTDLSDISSKLDKLETANEENWPEMQQKVRDILDVLSGNNTDAIKKALEENNLESLDKKLKSALNEAESSIEGMKNSLSGLGGMMTQMSKIFSGYNGSLSKLDKGLGSTRSDLLSMRQGLDMLADLMGRVASNEDLSTADRVLSDNTERFASYLASPVKMNTEIVYPIAEYGSAMAPFYTVLAQWVGALLTAVLIKVKVKERKTLPNPTLIQRYFGRYGLYMFIGLAQALIVSLGDLLYVRIQCQHPLMFILEACMNGICFTMINYAMVFALDNIGLGLGVIVLVLQVAGSGGTYPVEVLPKVFQVLYPFMPFRYAMDAMRECIAGTYDHTYGKCMGTLCIFIGASILLGLLLYKPALWINNKITESKQKSDVML